jgi:hypothetical protein
MHLAWGQDEADGIADGIECRDGCVHQNNESAYFKPKMDRTT